ncbi:MAG TPA: antibiotic biosynthesis monooxygenase [Thermomicrobiales bacterium]|nr:antibiotic biosynthesis monooxygenase [Thermomicrobiales bacterium]
MIARIWRGVVRTEDADRYVEYVNETGMPHYMATPGNLGAHILRSDRDGRTEILTLTFWASWDAVKAFAGDDPTIARYYPEDDAFLLEKPEHVEHYEVPYSSLSPNA